MTTGELLIPAVKLEQVLEFNKHKEISKHTTAKFTTMSNQASDVLRENGPNKFVVLKLKKKATTSKPAQLLMKQSKVNL